MGTLGRWVQLSAEEIAAITAHPELSHAELGRQIGRSRQTVRRIRAELAGRSLPTPHLLTGGQVATRLGVSRQRVAQLVAVTLLIPAVKGPRTTLFDPAEVERFAALERPVGRPSRVASR